MTRITRITRMTRITKITRMEKYKLGLYVMRAQPLHYGHIRTLNVALAECGKVVVAIGSTQEFGTKQNPFTFSERKKMLRNYYQNQIFSQKGSSDVVGWDLLHVIGLKDINNTLRWPFYVLEKLHEEIEDKVNIVYGGSDYDCHWFNDIGLITKIVNRADKEWEFVSATMIREMLTYGDPRWTDYVPECNWPIIEKRYFRP